MGHGLLRMSRTLALRRCPPHLHRGCRIVVRLAGQARVILVTVQPIGAISKTACGGGGHFDAPAASAGNVSSSIRAAARSGHIPKD